MKAATQAAPTQPQPADDAVVKSVAISQLVGAVLFTFGSACFVWAAWAEDWVQPFRVGCMAWICGCLPYLWPPLRNELADVGTGADASTAERFAAHLSNAL